MRPSLLVATSNVGKQAEFRSLLAGLPARLVTPAEIGLEGSPDEPYDTYAENASAKADAFCRASGLLTLADDSGLEVAALDWGPGVRTGRWGSADAARPPVDQLLDRLSGVEDRRARMVCWLAVASPAPGGPAIELFSGVLDGRIAAGRRGEGGFGYDPVFELPEGVTTAELTPAEKDRRSHRGRAVAAALARLRELLSTTPDEP